MEKTFTIRVDGEAHEVTADPAMPLLYALQNDLHKKGPKFGCGLAQCGACTVLQDGVPVRSCVLRIDSVQGEIRTLDGLGSAEQPHPVQRAFIEEEAGQCEYCISGWIMNATALLERNPQPDEQEIHEALVGLKCRCATQMSILRAIRRAARDMNGGAAGSR